MIGIRNIVSRSGFRYSEYLKKQLAEIVENTFSHKHYNAADLIINQPQEGELVVSEDNLKQYTRCGGQLFDAWGLSGHLNEDKLTAICNLELGIDDRTKSHVKSILKKRKTVEVEGMQIEVTNRDIQLGYFEDALGERVEFKASDVHTVEGHVKKTAIEFVLTQDATFSYCVAGMKAHERKQAETLFLDCATESYEEMFKQYLKDYLGNIGMTGYYAFYHNDNRSQNPFSHIHLNIPSLVKLPDGSIMAIEIPEIRQKDFHAMLDTMYKSKLVQKWQEQFPQYPIEAYDKDGEQIKHGSFTEIKDWRIAYDEPSLEKIRLNSKAKELIDKAIKIEKKDLFEKAESYRKGIAEKIEQLSEQLLPTSKNKPLGKYLESGHAKYKHEEDGTPSYFVTIELENGTKQTLWSKDLERALKVSNAKQGDFIELENLGQQPVTVNVPVKDESGKIIGWAPEMVHRNTWQVSNRNDHQTTSDQLQALHDRMAKVNQAYENKLKFLDSPAHRNDIWTSIKQPKKAVGKQFKDLQLAKSVDELNLKMKADADVGLAFNDKTDSQLVETLTNVSPFYSRSSLITELARASGIGSKAQQLADEKIKQWQEEGDLVIAGTNGNKQQLYTTRELIALEKSNVDMARGMVLAKIKPIVPDIESVLEGIKASSKFPLADEQVNFIRAANSTRQLEIVIGVPGAGKSATVNEIAKLCNANERRTIGIGPTGKVSAALADDTQVNMAMTIDKLNLDIELGKFTFTKNDVVILDEASMVGTRNWNKLLKNLNGAKLIALGDTNQISSVAVGNTLKEFCADTTIASHVQYLTEIRRQKDDVSLQIAKTTSLADDYRDGDVATIKKEGTHITKAISIMENEGRVNNTYLTSSEKLEALASEYLADENHFKEKLILCSVNTSIDRLNDLIQEKRLINKEIAGAYAENSKERFYIGDRIVMEKNNKQEYKNGDFGTVKAIHPNGHITIELDNGKIKDLRTVKNVRLSYATSINKSQGVTVNKTFINGENSLNNNQELFNVAVTRNRYMVKLYAVESEYKDVVASFTRENSKVSLIDLWNTYQNVPPVVPTPPIAQTQAQAIILDQTIANQLKQTALATEAIKQVALTPEQPSVAYRFISMLKSKFQAIARPVHKVFKKDAPDFIKQRPKPLHIDQIPILHTMPNAKPIPQIKVNQVKQPEVISKKVKVQQLEM